MSAPKSIIKINKNGVQYTSSVDRASYNIFELSRAAMRDVGKFLANRMRSGLRKLPGSKQNKDVKKYTAGYITFKVPFNPNGLPHLEVGNTEKSWYTADHELGSSTMPKWGIFRKAAYDNVAQIIDIESQYLSALEDEAKALSLISEEEYSGGGEET